VVIPGPRGRNGGDQCDIAYKGSQVLNNGDILVSCSQQDVSIARHDGEYD